MQRHRPGDRFACAVITSRSVSSQDLDSLGSDQKENWQNAKKKKSPRLTRHPSFSLVKKLRTLKSRIKRRRAEVDMAAGYIDEDRPELSGGEHTSRIKQRESHTMIRIRDNCDQRRPTRVRRRNGYRRAEVEGEGEGKIENCKSDGRAKPEEPSRLGQTAGRTAPMGKLSLWA